MIDTNPATAVVDVTIGAESIDTREAQRDTHLRSADFFDVGTFPTLTFKSRRVDIAGAGTVRLVGDLTMHGVTREVALDVTAEGAGKDPWGNNRAGFSAKGVVHRKDFGLVYNQILEAGGIAIGEDVKISIDVELVGGAA
jgi:polyisoprenoid-binding protein YceI